PEERAAVVEQTARLKALQEEPDPPEALAKIPALTLADLPRTNAPLPIEREVLAGIRTFTHPLATNGVIYLDLGFDMRRLSGKYLPLMSVFSRALTQTGTATEDFVALSQRIGRSTGGIHATRWVATKRERGGTAAWLFLRGKAVPDKAGELIAILRDVLTSARLDNRERIRQMVLEEKAGFESGLAGRGNGIVTSRLRAQFNESDWAGEQMGGVSYYFALKELARRIDNDWESVQADLEAMRRELLHRGGMVANVTAEGPAIDALRPRLADFLAGLPESGGEGSGWGFAPAARSEGLTFPGQVNYVAKGGNLIDLGFTPTGGSTVAVRHLNTTYLWDRIRVQGGAYGGSSGLDTNSGGFSFSSYRDPNLLATIANYDGAAAYLRQGIGEQDLIRSIIGVIGTIDTYRLPDAKGFTSLLFELSGETEELRQQRREEVLGATARDFLALAEALDQLARHGRVVVLGPESAIRAANDERGGFLEVTKVM
ncbi:MAG TPA: peptidase M16, partial [Alphaproteobacteria bacterium]|nr:peptidase M16 [Alphaproteobacteria bacterium]